jgi:hypothetical protein
MADNFLEKHYDDYENRRSQWEKKKALAKARAIKEIIKKKNEEKP